MLNSSLLGRYVYSGLKSTRYYQTVILVQSMYSAKNLSPNYITRAKNSGSFSLKILHQQPLNYFIYFQIELEQAIY